MVHTEGGRVSHSSTEAARAETTTLARKTYDAAVPAVLASHAHKTVGQDAAAKVRLELVAHESWELATVGFDRGPCPSFPRSAS